MTTEKNSNKNLHEFIDSWNDTAKAKITGKVLLLFQYYIIQYAKKHNNNPLNETTLQKIGDEFLVLFSNGQKKDDYLYHKRNLRIAFNLIEPVKSFDDQIREIKGSIKLNELIKGYLTEVRDSFPQKNQADFEQQLFLAILENQQREHSAETDSILNKVKKEREILSRVLPFLEKKNIRSEDFTLVLYLLCVYREEIIVQKRRPSEVSEELKAGHRKEMSAILFDLSAYYPSVGLLQEFEIEKLFGDFQDFGLVELTQNFGELFERIFRYITNSYSFRNGAFILHPNLIRLILTAAKVGEVRSVYNPLAANGVLLSVLDNKVDYKGQEYNRDIWRVAALRFYVYGRENELSNLELTSSIKHWRSDKDFDLIFSRLPLLNEFLVDNKTLEQFVIEQSLKSLKHNGKAVLLLSHAVFWSEEPNISKLKNRLIQNHQIERIINLPGSIFRYSGLPSTVIVLSNHKNNANYPVLNLDELLHSFTQREQVDWNKFDGLSDFEINLLLAVFNDIKKYPDSDFNPVVSEEIAEYHSLGDEPGYDDDDDFLSGNYSIDIDEPDYSIDDSQSDYPKKRKFSLDEFLYDRSDSKKEHSHREKSLGNYIEIGKTYSPERTDAYVVNEYHLTPDNLMLKTSDLKLIRAEQAQSSGMRLIKDEGVIVSLFSSQLNPTYFDGKSKVLIENGLLFLRIKKKAKISALYLIILLKSEKVQQQLQMLADINLTLKISREQILNLLSVNIPSRNQQESEIITYFSDYYDLLKKQSSEIIKEEVKEQLKSIQENNSLLRHKIAAPVSNLEFFADEITRFLQKNILEKFSDIYKNTVSDLTGYNLEQLLGKMKKNSNMIRKEVLNHTREFNPARYELRELDLYNWLEEFVNGEKILHPDIIYNLNLPAQFLYKPEENKVFIQGNESLLLIAFNNLFENIYVHAFQTNQTDFLKRIQINIHQNTTPKRTAYENEKFLSITISNTGKPLPEGFDIRDFLLKGVKKGENAGSGLGGFLIGSIVKYLKGNIEVVDETGFIGSSDLVSSFVITLPYHEVRG